MLNQKRAAVRCLGLGSLVFYEWRVLAYLGVSSEKTHVTQAEMKISWMRMQLGVWSTGKALS